MLLKLRQLYRKHRTNIEMMISQPFASMGVWLTVEPEATATLRLQRKFSKS